MLDAGTIASRRYIKSGGPDDSSNSSASYVQLSLHPLRGENEREKPSGKARNSLRLGTGRDLRNL